MNKDVLNITQRVKKSATSLANLKESKKNNILYSIYKDIKSNSKEIINKNNIDVKLAKETNIGDAKLDRLILDESRIISMLSSIEEIISLPDPLGRITYDVNRDNGLNIKRITVPLGVILAIYESRPNVTSDISALCFKSGNGVILKSGSDSYNSSNIIAKIFQDNLRSNGISKDAIFYIDNFDRNYTKFFLKMHENIDLVIPRGGKNLIKSVINETKIPVFKHLDGNCHTYIENSAITDLDKVRKVVVNAKMKRTGICGATESLVIDKKIASKILPLIVKDLSDLKCEIRGDEECVKIDSNIKLADIKDFSTEYLNKIISIKIVNNIDEAIEHINQYSSSHTEAIISNDKSKKEKFFREIDSAIVMHNTSTQFADGYEFGLGSEIGISTGKFHARGPIGLDQLVIYKYIVESNYRTR